MLVFELYTVTHSLDEATVSKNHQVLVSPSLKCRHLYDENQPMNKSALFIFHNGLEELEAIAPLDILRRSGVQCTAASASGQLEVIGRNEITLKADCLLEEVLQREFDLIVIPGGPSVYTLRKDERVVELVKNQSALNKLVAAICAAPTILKNAGLLTDKAYTAHFTVGDELPNIQETRAVVVDGNIITSRGAGTAVEFGLKLAEILTGETASSEVAESIHYQPESSVSLKTRFNR
jgi:4-methyl-5(b-hydroxyethyl)-thiazole monophosphate biosynthesis